MKVTISYTKHAYRDEFLNVLSTTTDQHFFNINQVNEIHRIPVGIIREILEEKR